MAAPPPKDISELPPDVLDYSNGPTILAQTASLFSVAALVLVMRCYVRIVMIKSFGRDDWAMAGAMIIATLCFALYVEEINLGIGKYTAVIQSDPDGFRRLLMLRWVHMPALSVGMTLVKISICFFLLRLLVKRAYIWFLWSVIGFLAAFTLACLGTLIFQCIPVQAAWDVRLRPPPLGTGTASCFSPETFNSIGLFNGVVHILTDILLAVLPVPLIWTLQLPLRTRLSLVIVLALGLFAAVAGIMRQVSVREFATPEPWIRDRYIVWNFIELDVGIIAASLPPLKPLFARFFDAARSTLKGSKNSTGYQKHEHTSDKDDFSMADFRSKGKVNITAHPAESSSETWHVRHRNNSRDSILPRESAGHLMGGIMVTKQVDIDALEGMGRGL